MSVKNRKVIVTGGGDGIGRAIAETFAEQGAMVHICDINAKRVTDMRRPDDGLDATQGDASNAIDIERVFEDALKRFNGGLDVLVNNAGAGGPTGPIESMTLDDWKSTFDVNVHSAFLCLKHAVPIMKAAGRGCIINISSTAGLMGYPLRTPYAGAKWALIGITKSLAMELGPQGIRVNAICPGSIDGPRMDRVIEAEAKATNVPAATIRAGYVRQSSMRTFIKARDIANMAVFMASDAGNKISGQAVSVDGHNETLSTH